MQVGVGAIKSLAAQRAPMSMTSILEVREALTPQHGRHSTFVACLALPAAPCLCCHVCDGCCGALHSLREAA